MGHAADSLLDTERVPRLLGMPQVVLHLLVHPALGGRAKRQRQPYGHLGTNAGAGIEDARERLSTHAERRGGLRHRQSQRLHGTGLGVLRQGGAGYASSWLNPQW